jgi:hypothetical protein
MKHLIAFILLTNITFATEDYRENPDGSSSYIGRCMLHEDYENELFTVTEIKEYESDPKLAYLNTLNELQLELVLFALGDLGFFENGETTIDDKMHFFDDITLQEIKMIDNKFKNEKIYRISYGAGGGNGGFLTVKLNTKLTLNGKTHYLWQKIAHTFDSDVENCGYYYQKPEKLLTKVPVRK